MTKRGGLGMQVWLDGYDIGGDVQQINRIGGGPATVFNFTPVTKLAFERGGGGRDGGIDITTFWNPSNAGGDAAHQVLRTLPMTDRTVSVALASTLGADAASVVAKQGNYDGTRAQDGMLTMAVQAMANGFGLEWGRLLTAGKRTDSTATNGTGVDFTASTAFGLQAYLHVFAFTGTSVTVKLQESSDNGAGDAWADVVGGAFTAASAIGTQRIQTARNLTVERYLRVVTTGTFSNAVFAVSVAKNDVSVVF